MEDTSYSESLAGDLFNILSSAKDSGMDLDEGFQNTPMNGPHIFMHYIFQPLSQLKNVPGMPENFKRRLKKSNILATVDVGEKKLGIFILAAFDKPFSQVHSPDDIVAAMRANDVLNFTSLIKDVLKMDLEAQMGGGEA